MVGGAVAGVQRVRLVVARHHALHAGRPEHPHRRRGPGGGPALDGQAAQPADVVGVEVGQQHGLDVLGPDLHAVERLGGPLAGVDDEHAPSGDDRHGGVAALWIRKRRPGPDDRRVEAVGEIRHRIGGHP